MDISANVTFPSRRKYKVLKRIESEEEMKEEKEELVKSTDLVDVTMDTKMADQDFEALSKVVATKASKSSRKSRSLFPLWESEGKEGTLFLITCLSRTSHFKVSFIHGKYEKMDLRNQRERQFYSEVIVL